MVFFSEIDRNLFKAIMNPTMSYPLIQKKLTKEVFRKLKYTHQESNLKPSGS